MQGWIKVHRKIIESDIWSKPPLYLKVWMYLLISAQHSEFKKLKPGQVYTSIPEIIDACSWQVGARIERPTKDQIYQALEFLRGKGMKSQRSPHESNAKATMITTTKATHGLLINICKYSDYQDIASDESNDESNDEKAAKGARKQRQPDNINKNDKNVNNDKNEDIKNIYDQNFELFWNAYPRKLGKQECYKVWKKLIKNKADIDEIVQCAINYAKQCEIFNTDVNFIKHPKTFLNEDRYKDYIDEPVTMTQKKINHNYNQRQKPMPSFGENSAPKPTKEELEKMRENARLLDRDKVTIQD